MKQLILLLLLLPVLAACKKSKKSVPDPVPVKPLPAIAVQLAPASNSTCTTGRVLSATESAVTFSWNSSLNTDTYDLIIKNLLTGTSTTKPGSATQAEVTLLRNTPYSWYVLSKSVSTTVTSQSEVWKFYNAGPASSSYAPFPAEILTPLYGQNVNAVGGKITLDWNGADTENDITGYDVYLGAAPSALVAIRSNIAASVVTDADVTSGTTYYWKVITKDSKNNTSDSGIFQFRVN